MAQAVMTTGDMRLQNISFLNKIIGWISDNQKQIEKTYCLIIVILKSD